MKVIHLTQGYVTVVDDEDFEGLSKYKWRACKDGNMIYAIAHMKNPRGFDRTIRMHRVILGLWDSDIIVDHIDRDGLNNIKSNLRACNKSENGCNRPKQANNTSGYKGVSYDKSKGMYKARIQKDGVEVFLGSFYTAKGAGEEYEFWCEIFHREFARTK